MPLYFSSLLSNLSVLAIYISLKTLVSLLISLVLMIGLFIHSYSMNSYVGMFFNLVNFSLFCGFYTAKNGRGTLYNCLVVLVILLSMAAFTEENFEIYFKLVDIFMKKIMPQYFVKLLVSLKSFNNCKEMELMQNILGVVEKYILGDN